MFWRGIIKSYNLLLQAHPFKTVAVTSGFLASSGDVIAQQLVEKKGKEHSIFRTCKFFVIGSCFIAPVLRTWYGVLEKIVIGSAGTAAIKKVACDQFFFAPPFIASFFTVSDLLSGKTFGDVKQNLNENYLSALKTNYYIWPAVQTLNFYLIPLSHRVIFVNIVALFWNSYLSWIVSRND